MKKLIGYYPNWSQWHTKRRPAGIRAELFTHLNYAFAMMNDSYELTTFEDNDEELYQEFIELKKKNRRLKCLLAVGGWNFNTPGWTNKNANGGRETYKIFSDMIQFAKGRRAFATQAGKFLRERNFDGLDLDWEYPGDKSRGGRDNDGIKLIKFVELFKQINPDLLLTMASPAGPHHYERLPLGELSKFLDWYNLMSYDFSGHSWTPEIGGHTRLNPEHAKDPWSGDNAVQAYIDAGVPRAKIVYGLAAYGRVFGGVEGLSQDDYFAGKKHDPKRAPKYSMTRQTGHGGYNELLPIVESGIFKLKKSKNKDYSIAYRVEDREWAGFDMPDDIKMKCNYVRGQGLGGAMFWSLDMDVKLPEDKSLIYTAHKTLNQKSEPEVKPVPEIIPEPEVEPEVKPKPRVTPEPRVMPKPKVEEKKDGRQDSKEGGSEERRKEEKGESDGSNKVGPSEEKIIKCGNTTVKIVVHTCCHCEK